MKAPRIFVSMVLALLLTVGVFLSLRLATSQQAEMEFADDPPNVQFEHVDLPSCLAQQQLEEYAKRAISESRTCGSDDDCIVKHYGCPFGCATAINAQFLEAVESAVSQYTDYIADRNCDACFYMCRLFAPPTPVCRESMCDYETIDPQTRPPVADFTDPTRHLEVIR